MEKPHQIGLIHLREDLPEGGVHLLSHPGPLIPLFLSYPDLMTLLFLSHPGSLVLMTLGQPFPYKEQLPLRLSLCLGNCLQLPQGMAEAECFLGLPACVSIGVGGGSKD